MRGDRQEALMQCAARMAKKRTADKQDALVQTPHRRCKKASATAPVGGVRSKGL